MLRSDIIRDDIPANIGRSIIIAIGFHVLFLTFVFWIPTRSIEASLTEPISVVIVQPRTEDKLAEIDASLKRPEPVTKPAPSQQKPKPKPLAEPETAPIDEGPIDEAPEEQTPVTIIQSDELTSEPGESLPAKSHIPSRWALKPPLSEQRLEGLGFTPKDIECLTSLEDDCQDLRKAVFAEYQLTETELVWTPYRADTGMPAEFRGLSEQEILEKLGMNYAGGNALVIFPGIAIDGPLWDKLHGVNKTCSLQRAITGSGSEEAGGIGVRRVCD